jgi:hypothetical protein
MLRYLALPAFLLAAACASAPAETLAVPTLAPLWVAEGFQGPEGAAMAADGSYYISNVFGDSGAKDGNGYIAKLSSGGVIVERYWSAKLNAPKGMAILDGTLYVTDIDRVVMIDAETGSRKGQIPIEGALFLNDATVWNGQVFVSDSGSARIHVLDGETASVWMEDEVLMGVNGLLGDADRMLVSTMTAGDLLSVDADRNVSRIATGMEDGDGIGLVPGGGYLVSSWPGQVHYAGEDGTVTTLLDTTGDETPITQNDLTVFGDVVIVPNLRNGSVTAWKVAR